MRNWKADRSDPKTGWRIAEGKKNCGKNLEEMQATQENPERREDELIQYAEEAAARELLNKKLKNSETKIKNLTEKGSGRNKPVIG